MLGIVVIVGLICVTVWASVGLIIGYLNKASEEKKTEIATMMATFVDAMEKTVENYDIEFHMTQKSKED